MHRSSGGTGLMVAAALVFLAGGCGDQRNPTEVTRAAPTAAELSRGDPGPQHAGAIVAHDSCDPESFNLAIGPGTCVKPGTTTFQAFLAELGAPAHTVRDWRFTPGQLTARFGVNLLGNNVGGEEHTFTPVREFGGGFVDVLNQIGGTPVPAQECVGLPLDDVVPSGGKYIIEAEELAEVADASGLARIQCCIHPWMHATVRMQH